MANINESFFLHYKTKEGFQTDFQGSLIQNTQIAFIQETNEIWTHGTFYKCSVDLSSVSEAIQQAIANIIVQELGENEDKVLSQKAVNDIIDSVKESILDLSLINEPVYNTTLLFPGETINTLSAAITKLDTVLTSEEKVEGIIIKFKDESGLFQRYIFNGGTFTEESSWKNQTVVDIPEATQDQSGLMSSTDKTKLDGLDSELQEIKDYTVNSHKISENPVLTKDDIELGNVTNDAQVKRSEMGVASGVATLDESGKIPSSQLPSYVDDVIEVDTFDSLPETGESGKIYVAKDTNLTYRWSGSQYVEISSSLALGETSSTAYPGDKGKETTDNLNLHISNTSNPHQVTKDQVGLGNVENLAPSDLPISDAAQEALDSLKDTVDNYTINGNKISENPALTKADIGLGNVDNTSDLSKPISTATQEALNTLGQTIEDETARATNKETELEGSIDNLISLLSWYEGN